MPTRMRLIGAKYSGGAAGVVDVTCRAVDGLRVRSLSHPVKKALAATGERAALYKTRNFPGAPVQSLAMLSYALRRIAGFVPTLLVVITASFFVMRLAPGGPFDQEQALPPRCARISSGSMGSTSRSRCSTRT